MRLWMLFMVLVGCGSAAQYGDFVHGQPQMQSAVAADAAKKMAIEYPPENHAVQIGENEGDSFGRDLAAELRKAGYAVTERAGSPADGDLRVQYVLDKLKGTDLLRVTLYVQRRTLSRAYAQRADGVYPAGPWSSGEP